ncbi:plastocyanin/azurin family copper-binding protein [Sphingomonas alba]|uniref:Plastocyanin/azurin family copper-binding protein n=1 Tax=Sphingomonas alba TaxID=2908208 RepID=A0ABT0RP56_9SPHN|nr:plastocyanin/azurin family copper-binding protein [Sphingomonas alba]MCL6684300.1 plastocyanin/azurin family copper-binding protein [Sphingomonas alba]
MKSLVAFSLMSLIALNPLRAADPSVVQVTMTSFNFNPATVQLRAGIPTVLQLRNDAGGAHNFSAPAFFAAAHIDPASSALIHDGHVEVKGHAQVDITLTPAAGQYPLKCTHPLHSSFGMKGSITVR